MTRPKPRFRDASVYPQVPGSKYKIIGDRQKCTDNKGCLASAAMFPIMSLRKRVACRPVNSNGLKRSECVVTKTLECFVYVGKDDYDYAGVKFGKQAYQQSWTKQCCNGGRSGIRMQYYGCMKPEERFCPVETFNGSLQRA